MYYLFILIYKLLLKGWYKFFEEATQNTLKKEKKETGEVAEIQGRWAGFGKLM